MYCVVKKSLNKFIEISMVCMGINLVLVSLNMIVARSNTLDFSEIKGKRAITLHFVVKHPII